MIGDLEYLELIRALPCCACGHLPMSDPHHTKTRGSGGRDGGAIPLCRRCHSEIHMGIEAFETKHRTTIPILMAETLHLVLFGQKLLWPGYVVNKLFMSSNGKELRL